MTANVATLPDGTYTASASSVHSTYEAYMAFGGSFAAVGWHSADPRYTSSGGYTGSASLGGVTGEWIALKLPFKLTLSDEGIHIAPRTGYRTRTPRDFTLLASTDGSTWTTLGSITGIVSSYYYDGAATPFRPDRFQEFSTQGKGTYDASAFMRYYDNFAIVIQASNGGTSIQIPVIRIYGTLPLISSPFNPNSVFAPPTDEFKLGDVRGHEHDSSTIVDGAITTAKLKDGAVTKTKLAVGAITHGKVQNASVTAAQLADKSVSSVNGAIATSAITTAKMPNSVITFGTGANGVGYGNLASALALGGNMGVVSGYDRANGGHVMLQMAQANATLRYGMGLFSTTHKVLAMWAYNSSGAYISNRLNFYRDGHLDIGGSISAGDGFDGPSVWGKVPVARFQAGRNEVNATSDRWETSFPIGTAVLYYNGQIGSGGWQWRTESIILYLISVQ